MRRSLSTTQRSRLPCLVLAVTRSQPRHTVTPPPPTSGLAVDLGVILTARHTAASTQRGTNTWSDSYSIDAGGGLLVLLKVTFVA